MPDRPIVIYLAHPFTGNPLENVQNVTRIARYIIHLSENGHLPHFYAPLVPHLALSVYAEDNNPKIRSTTEALSQAMVCACDELWIVSPTISSGMRLEIATAKKEGIPVRKWTELAQILPEIEKNK